MVHIDHATGRDAFVAELAATRSLRLARQTVVELAGGAFPLDLAQTDVILIGSGRLPAPPPDHRFTGLTVPAFG